MANIRRQPGGYILDLTAGGKQEAKNSKTRPEMRREMQFKRQTKS